MGPHQKGEGPQVSTGPSYCLPCPNCGYGQSWVKDTRARAEDVRRRRECGRCAYRFTTLESVVPSKERRSSLPLRIALTDAIDRLGLPSFRSPNE